MRVERIGLVKLCVHDACLFIFYCVRTTPIRWVYSKKKKIENKRKHHTLDKIEEKRRGKEKSPDIT